MLPGELEWREEQRASRDGIPMPEGDWTALRANLEAAGIPTDVTDRFAPDS